MLLCIWKSLSVTLILLFLTGKLPWSALPMTLCFPEKRTEIRDPFLGPSSRQPASCLGKHVNWRRKVKSEPSALSVSSGRARMPVWKVTFVRWMTLTWGGRPVFFLARVEQTRPNYTWLARLSRQDLRVLFSIIWESLASKSALRRTREGEIYDRGCRSFPLVSIKSWGSSRYLALCTPANCHAAWASGGGAALRNFHVKYSQPARATAPEYICNRMCGSCPHSNLAVALFIWSSVSTFSLSLPAVLPPTPAF